MPFNCPAPRIRESKCFGIHLRSNTLLFYVTDSIAPIVTSGSNWSCQHSEESMRGRKERVWGGGGESRCQKKTGKKIRSISYLSPNANGVSDIVFTIGELSDAIVHSNAAFPRSQIFLCHFYPSQRSNCKALQRKEFYFRT